MAEPCGHEIACPGFQLQLEHSTTSSQMSQKNSSECGVKLVLQATTRVFLGCGQFERRKC